MRKHIIYILASAALMAGCAEKEAAQHPKGYGSFHLNCTALPSTTDTAPNVQTKTRAEVLPSPEEFSLTLTGEGYSGKWATTAAFAAADTLFLEGPYKAQIAWGDPNAEGFEKPSYTGSADFTIDALVFDKSVEITAKIANSLVVIRATRQFLRYFNDVKFNVTTASKNSFDMIPAAADYTSPEDYYQSEAAYVKAGTALKINGTAKRQSQTGSTEGLSVKFEEQSVEQTQPRTRHIFRFDAANAGSATLDIFIGTDENGEDKYVETRILDIELNEAAKPDPTE